jgi:hypothetical protein
MKALATCCALIGARLGDTWRGRVGVATQEHPQLGLDHGVGHPVLFGLAHGSL